MYTRSPGGGRTSEDSAITRRPASEQGSHGPPILKLGSLGMMDRVCCNGRKDVHLTITVSTTNGGCFSCFWLAIAIHNG